ncbi:MAG: cytochrome c oxidase subunit 3 [Chlorobia bacterium]|nr:cytochrome c oxidase subunit 3 [Fimbriimonadaceae bacterium]
MASAHAEVENFPVHVHVQFEDIEQQNETYLVGMWAFMVTEVMFFGALFLAYILYRWHYQPDFYMAHKGLDWKAGAVNTTLLLLSSFTMVLGVHFAQLRKHKLVVANLAATCLLATGFLLIKFLLEWPAKFSHHLVPGYSFGTHPEYLYGASPRSGELFYSLYFLMTGLHAIHIIIGIIIIGALAWMWQRNDKIVSEDYIPTELVGLYWHFVDLVWIFLFPLFYLIPQ